LRRPIISAPSRIAPGKRNHLRRQPSTPFCNTICQKATSRLSFDHLVGAAGQGQRDGDPERLGGLEVQKQFRFTSLRDARAPNAL
jgi:hypothetical protein